MRTMPELEDMVLLQKGSRLSISPVTLEQWKAILKRMHVHFTPKKKAGA
jgi:predicted RNA-binding protein with PUA-like domain